MRRSVYFMWTLLLALDVLKRARHCEMGRPLCTRRRHGPRRCRTRGNGNADHRRHAHPGDVTHIIPWDHMGWSIRMRSRNQIFVIHNALAGKSTMMQNML